VASGVDRSLNTGALYTRDLSGLAACYAVALPFWGRTLAGDLLFSGALFGLYELAARRMQTEASSTLAPSTDN